jgi:DNA topoisomerase-1
MATKLQRLTERFEKKKIAKVDKEEGKSIALSTSKLNYLDPRISVAWCKRFSVPIEKVVAVRVFLIRCR